MKYDRAEAVRYMGAKKDDNEAAVLKCVPEAAGRFLRAV